MSTTEVRNIYGEPVRRDVLDGGRYGCDVRHRVLPLRVQRGRLSPKSETAKAIDYMLRRWASFALFLEDGRVCLSNNAAERAIRGIAVGRRNWTFAGSDVGGHRAAALYTLIETCKLNDVDPRAWLADVLARLPEHPAKRLAELLPWNWKAPRNQQAAA